MHESIFSYNVTRKYPYAWFTWVAIIGGIVATAIFSVINVAANGYQLNVIISSNPNETESPERLQWFQKMPWAPIAKVSPRCQDQTLTVGSQFYTTNFGFPYKIIGLSKRGGEPMTSIIYHNDFLHDCFVVLLPFTAYGTLGDMANFYVQALLNCTIYEDSAPVTMSLTISMGIFKSGAGGDPHDGLSASPVLLSLDNTTRTSLHWGRNLMWLNSDFLIRADEAFPNYYQVMSRTASERSIPGADLDPKRYVQGFSILTGCSDDQNPCSAGFGTSTTLDGLFPEEVWASTFAGDMTLLEWFTNEQPDMLTNISDFRTIQILLLDGIAKSLYSSILSDLGQTANTNTLTDPEKTMNFFKKTLQLGNYAFGKEIADTVLNDMGMSESPPDGLDEFYRWAEIAKPSVAAATISMQYVCQIPKLKSTGSLIVSVVVANVVFLQVLWFVLNWLTTWAVQYKNPEANCCIGCASALHNIYSDQETDLATVHDCAKDTVRQSVVSMPSLSRRSYELIPETTSRTSNNISASDQAHNEEGANRGLLHRGPMR